ncbi:MAG: DNA cytosine methyltransferase [Chloroflexi bacterium]|nr:DNA cytosine methyltransferase [Chloroflexota bacterium]
MPTFAEFFAGIGLVRMAIEPLGWQCCFANDISEEKASVYTHWFGSDHLAIEDVRDVQIEDVPAGVALFTASFPCIDVSLAGNRNGINGRHSGAVWPFLDLVARYSRRTGAAPRAVLLENVVGLIASNGGRDLAGVIRNLNQIGYRCDVVLVDAKSFVPQSRPRVFIIGLQDGDPTITRFPAGEESRLRPAAVIKFFRQNRDLCFGESSIPLPPRMPLIGLDSIVDWLAHNQAELWWPPDKVARLISEMNPIHRERLRSLGRAQGPRYATMYRRVRQGRAVGEIRADGIAGCLRTPVGGSSVQFLVEIDSDRIRIRPMTAIEYGRLQGVTLDLPAGFRERQGLHAFGDAVCVPAVRWLVGHAFQHLTESGPTGKRPLGPLRDRMLEGKKRISSVGARVPIHAR